MPVTQTHTPDAFLINGSRQSHPQVCAFRVSGKLHLVLQSQLLALGLYTNGAEH